MNFATSMRVAILALVTQESFAFAPSLHHKAQLVAPLNGVKAYFSVGSTNKDIEERQRQIEKIFESKKIHYEVVDVTTAGDYEKQAMRQVCKDLRALPPQIANDGEYCGDFNMFEAAVQKDDLDDFLKLRP